MTYERPPLDFDTDPSEAEWESVIVMSLDEIGARLNGLNDEITAVKSKYVGPDGTYGGTIVEEDYTALMSLGKRVVVADANPAVREQLRSSDPNLPIEEIVFFQIHDQYSRIRQFLRGEEGVLPYPEDPILARVNAYFDKKESNITDNASD